MSANNLAALRAAIARSTRKFGRTAPETIDARRAYAAARLESYVEAIVRDAPPFTERQKARISAILNAAPIALENDNQVTAGAA